MKVLHILYQSLPQISGSSIRSRDILMSQKEIGLEPVAVTSPFQIGDEPQESINGITYFRTSIGRKDSISDKQKPFLQRIKRLVDILPFYLKVKRIINKENPHVLHAHAMFFCGLPAIFLAKKFNIPVVYEVRSLWMLKKSNEEKRYWDGFLEKLLLKIELIVIKRVDLVIAINENLKQELINQGVNGKTISVVNNAVNTSLINQLMNNVQVESSNTSQMNFGYIGTLTPHEGLDFLIDVFSDFNSKYPNTQLFIYGTGIERDQLVTLSKKCSKIHVLGAVKPEEIPKAFANIDVIVNPRYKNKLTDSVTPLKPLEAMAYNKLFIGSDVGGIKELVTHEENGLLFKAGDYQGLMNVLERGMLLKSEERNLIIERAKEYVITNKSWKSNAKKYAQLYQDLIRRK